MSEFLSFLVPGSETDSTAWSGGRKTNSAMPGVGAAGASKLEWGGLD